MPIKTDVKITPEELETLASTILKAFPSGLTIKSLTQSVITCMGIVGQFKNMKGADKKQLVIDMLIFILDKTDSGIFELIEPFIKEAIPDLIDELIDVEKGKIRFNPKLKNKLNCFGCMN